MSGHVSQLLEGLAEPGRVVVFCDDTDIDKSPNDWLVPGLRILCAVAMTSEHYAKLSAAMQNRLQALGQSEFHATEIVNPPKSCSWRQVSVENRIAALAFLRDLLAEPPTKFYYIFVSKGQYQQLRQEAQALGHVNLGHKAGLKRVFLLSLFERLQASGIGTVLVMDQEKSGGPTVENWKGGAFLLGGGPITADSASVPGLQLADMVAFCISRYVLKRQAIIEEQGSPFDNIALETVAGFEGRIEFLMKSAQAA